MLKIFLSCILALNLFGGMVSDVLINTSENLVKEAYNKSEEASKEGRKGKQERLKAILDDDKEASRFKGWVQQEVNQIERGKRKNIRVPIGYDLAHQRGKEARKGYGYEYSNLLDKKLHRTQHKYDNNGKKR